MLFDNLICQRLKVYSRQNFLQMQSYPVAVFLQVMRSGWYHAGFEKGTSFCYIPDRPVKSFLLLLLILQTPGQFFDRHPDLLFYYNRLFDSQYGQKLPFSLPVCVQQYNRYLHLRCKRLPDRRYPVILHCRLQWYAKGVYQVTGGVHKAGSLDF